VLKTRAENGYFILVWFAPLAYGTRLKLPHSCEISIFSTCYTLYFPTTKTCLHHIRKGN